MKKYIPFAIFIICVCGVLIAESVKDVQVIDAETRNRLETIIGAGSGGGGSSLAITTTNSSSTVSNLTVVGTQFLSTTLTNYMKNSLVLGTNISSTAGYDFYIDKRRGNTTAANIIWESSSGGDVNFLLGSDVSDLNRLIQFYGGGSATYNWQIQNGLTSFIVTMDSASATFDMISGASRKTRVSASGLLVGPNGVALTNIVSATIAADAPSLPTLQNFQTNIAVTGSVAGKPVSIGCTTNNPGLVITGYCPSNGVIWVDFANATAGTIDQQPNTVQAIQFVTP